MFSRSPSIPQFHKLQCVHGEHGAINTKMTKVVKSSPLPRNPKETRSQKIYEVLHGSDQAVTTSGQEEAYELDLQGPLQRCDSNAFVKFVSIFSAQDFAVNTTAIVA